MSFKKQIKVFVKLTFRKVEDSFNRIPFAIKKSEEELPYKITIQQPFISQEFLENKKHNLKVASEKINQIIIYPNEIFSFWKIIKNPNNTNVYKSGRSLVAGKLQEQIGGGLCQISGAIFHLALLSRLEIVERHQHSVDIYTEKNRYTPLGTDATVVFGYKDLRIRNPYHFPIKFRFSVEENHFIGELYSKEKIETSALTFEIKSSENQKTVSIIDNGKIISVSHYKNQSL